MEKKGGRTSLFEAFGDNAAMMMLYI